MPGLLTCWVPSVRWEQTHSTRKNAHLITQLFIYIIINSMYSLHCPLQSKWPKHSKNKLLQIHLRMHTQGVTCCVQLLQVCYLLAWVPGSFRSARPLPWCKHKRLANVKSLVASSLWWSKLQFPSCMFFQTLFFCNQSGHSQIHSITVWTGTWTGPYYMHPANWLPL